MKKLVLTLLVLLFIASFSVVAQKRKGGRTLTLAVAQRVLNQQIDEGTVDNVLFTCRACYDPDDKAENDNSPIVTYNGTISQFLARKGYVRRNRNGDEFFTAKAKRSQYFEAFGDGTGRLANSKNVPIEYDVVPTAITKEFLGATKRVQSTASFSYEDGRWSVCIGCSN